MAVVLRGLGVIDINPVVARAKEEAFAIEMALTGLRTSVELRTLRAHWKAILMSYAAAVSHLRKGADTGSAKGWSDAMMFEQRNNSVLRYMLHARNHDVHQAAAFPSSPQRGFASVENLIENWNTEGKVNFFGGTSSTFLQDGRRIDRKLDGSLSYENGSPKVDLGDQYNVKIVRQYLKLEDVVDRGVTYPVPDGVVPIEAQAVNFAEHVLAWLNTKIVEFESLRKPKQA